MLTVAEMRDRFGRSRVLLREVTKTLVAKGMVVTKSRVGTHVLPPEHWNWFDPDVLAWRVQLGLDARFLAQLGEMRRAVEPTAAALAAVNRGDADLAAMRAATEAMAGEGFARADLAFHIAVATASGNPLFRAFAGVIEAALAASLSESSPRDPADAARTAARHQAIVDAIEARDAGTAAARMLTVIDEGLARFTKDSA